MLDAADCERLILIVVGRLLPNVVQVKISIERPCIQSPELSNVNYHVYPEVSVCSDGIHQLTPQEERIGTHCVAVDSIRYRFPRSDRFRTFRCSYLSESDTV